MTTDIPSPQELLSRRKEQLKQYMGLRDEAMTALGRIYRQIADCERDIYDLEFLLGTMSK